MGLQHVLAMFGATFVFPVLMGLDPNLAILLSGFATMLFLLMTRGRVPSYLGTSASFVGVVAAVRADGGTSAEVTGAIAVTGVVLALVGLAVHLGGARVDLGDAPARGDRRGRPAHRVQPRARGGRRRTGRRTRASRW